jgi:hypothetical protein
MGNSRTGYGKRKTRSTAKAAVTDTSSEHEKSSGSPSPTGSSSTIDPTTDGEILSENGVVALGDNVPEADKGLNEMGGVGDLEESELEVEELPKDLAPKQKRKTKKAAKKTAPVNTATPTISIDAKPRSE